MLRETDEAIRQNVRNHLAGSCFVDMSMIDDDASFMETGILDSVGFLEMVAFLERTFQISIKDDEMAPENMDSISKILHYLKGKRGEHSPE